MARLDDELIRDPWKRIRERRLNNPDQKIREKAGMRGIDPVWKPDKSGQRKYGPLNSRANINKKLNKEDPTGETRRGQALKSQERYAKDKENWQEGVYRENYQPVDLYDRYQERAYSKLTRNKNKK